MAAHLQLSMPEHFQRMIGHMATLQQSVQALQGKTSALELECLSLVSGGVRFSCSAVH